jgi:hypothetical protein
MVGFDGTKMQASQPARNDKKRRLSKWNGFRNILKTDY